MTITEIYQKYTTMPSLQEHQLRVAAVALRIARNAEEKLIDWRELITACLLHDMGNIIKFNLSLYPQFLEPEGLEYWQRVKAKFIATYGKDEHKATLAIARELGINKRAIEILTSIGFSNALKVSKSGDLSKLIACYSDQRVTPRGVTSLVQRMQEGRDRFRINKKIKNSERKKYQKKIEIMATALQKMEKRIFAQVTIGPDEITNESIKAIQKELRRFKICNG